MTMSIEWKTMDSAPLDGTEVLVSDGFGVLQAAYDADTTLEEFLTFCDDDEGEAEWLAYIAENPGQGWVSRECVTGDFIFLDPMCWTEMPAVPAQFGRAERRVVMSEAMGSA